MKNILVVCVGNICRSPLAEALLKRSLPGREVASAGLHALVGSPADPLSIEVAQAHAVDLSGHSAQQVSGWLCQQAELILVMEQAHKQELEQQYPLTRGKVFRLGEWLNIDIADPYRQPKPAFELAWRGIEQCVATWVPRILKLG
jgi:protein-tyrosine phosphatase